MKKSSLLFYLFLILLPWAARSQEDLSVFSDPALKLKEIGKLKAMSSSQITGSALSIGFETLDRRLFEPEKCYDKLEATGIKWARCQTGWNRCETVKGQYDFKWLDDVVDNLLKRGVQPWFNVGYGNKLYMPDATGEAAVGWVPVYYGEEGMRAWGNFVKALAQHFKGRVSHYEIWNEANIDAFWQPGKANPGDYLKLITFTTEIIKKEDKNAKTGACVAGSTDNYVVDLVKTGVAKYIDFFSIHGYRILLEKDHRNEVETLRRILAENGGAHVEIWQGEAGYGSYFPRGHFLGTWHRGNEINQAKWLLRRYSLDLSLGLQLTSFFQMVDMNSKPYYTSSGVAVNPCLHGILHGKTYEPKQAYYTARNFAAIFDNDTKSTPIFASLNLEKRRPKSDRISRLTEVAAVTAGFTRFGYPLYLYYLPEDVQMNFPGITDISLRTLKDTPKIMEKPVLVDLLDGRVFSVESFKNGTCNNLPLTDYPLVITDLQAISDRIELK